MYHLRTYTAGFDEPSYSPFCAKTIYMLSYSKTPWKRVDTLDPRTAPQGKLPVLEADGKTIHDSENIYEFLKAKGVDFDAKLPADQTLASQATIRMVEEHLYFQLVYDRWINPDVWVKTKPAYFGHLPWPIKHLVPNTLQKSLHKTLKGHGMARFYPQERIARAVQDITALDRQLDGKPFLFGDKPTRADFSVVPILRAIRATPVDTDLKTSLDQCPALCDYLDRAHDLFLNPK